MEDIIDLIATNASPANVSDAIKNALFAKAAERIDAVRPSVSTSIFNENDLEQEYDDTDGGEEYYEDEDE
jgi:hypothetical protein